MARSVAEQPALKSLLAVVIFALLVLSGTYFGAYTFCPATYDSTAVVQLVVGPNVSADAAREYINQQATGLRNDGRVLSAAWRDLRERGAAAYSNVDSWKQAVLPDVEVTADAAARTLTIRARASSADGAAMTANALAGGYVSTVRAATLQGQPVPQVMTAAEIPGQPLRDNRRMIALSASAVVLFLALLGAMTMRQTIRRQLSAIDNMAEREDLEAARADLPEARLA
jgi:hypothetical protein